jgi:hypothetical protein
LDCCSRADQLGDDNRNHGTVVVGAGCVVTGCVVTGCVVIGCVVIGVVVAGTEVGFCVSLTVVVALVRFDIGFADVDGAGPDTRTCPSGFSSLGSGTTGSPMPSEPVSKCALNPLIAD